MILDWFDLVLAPMYSCSGGDLSRKIYWLDSIIHEKWTSTSSESFWSQQGVPISCLQRANCIPMIKCFRAGLPRSPKTGKPFTAKLDVLFPILFAGHKLIGKSQRALPDTQMLRLLVLLLVQLQNHHKTEICVDFHWQHKILSGMVELHAPTLKSGLELDSPWHRTLYRRLKVLRRSFSMEEQLSTFVLW